MGKRSIAAIVVSALAVLVLGVGVAAASGYLITNIHQIRPSVRAELKGKRGPRGLAGPAGPAGPSGPAGTPGANTGTHGYETFVNGPVDITSDRLQQSLNLQTIGQLSLPAGTFDVTAKASYRMMGSAGLSTDASFDCRLRDSIEGPYDFASVGGWLGAPNSVSQGGIVGTASLAGDVSHTAPAKEIVECGDTEGAAGVDYTIYSVVIQAVQLNGLG